MRVIGTAGHIDHGKSALVRRLTGTDPDRLEEEKRRGMTIDLGFASLELPSGAQASVVDVPGHERFVKNMLAGAAGVDVALLVVAADESVMPQTREHVAILDLLGVTRGVVALTKVDLVDEELRLLVALEVDELLAGTGLAGSRIVPVSAVTGEGIEELRAAIDAALAAGGTTPPAGIPHLPIDRVFTAPGFGTVVTGTLHGGGLAIDQEVEVVPGGRRARIRGIQVHNHPVSFVEAGGRLAVNLAGVERSALRRGMLLAAPGLVRAVRVFDASVAVLAHAPVALRHGQEVAVHVGAAESNATVSVLGADAIEPGHSGWIQVRLAEPVALLPRQRFIMRLPSPVGTVAGGTVLDIRPRHRRWDPATLDRLRALVSGDQVRVVRALVRGRVPLQPERLAAESGYAREAVDLILDRLVHEGTVVRLGDGYLAAEEWRELKERLARSLTEFHARNPMRPGMPREDLRRRAGLQGAAWAAALDALERDGTVRLRGGLVALSSHRGGTAARGDEVERVLNVLRIGRYSPPAASELAAAARTDASLLDALAQEGRIVRLSPSLYFDAEVYQEAVEAILGAMGDQGPLTVADVRDLLNTSRRYALALLEHMDGERLTHRQGDVRVPGSRARTCV